MIVRRAFFGGNTIAVSGAGCITASGRQANNSAVCGYCHLLPELLFISYLLRRYIRQKHYRSCFGCRLRNEWKGISRETLGRCVIRVSGCTLFYVNKLSLDFAKYAAIPSSFIIEYNAHHIWLLGSSSRTLWSMWPWIPASGPFGTPTRRIQTTRFSQNTTPLALVLLELFDQAFRLCSLLPRLNNLRSLPLSEVIMPLGLMPHICRDLLVHADT